MKKTRFKKFLLFALLVPSGICLLVISASVISNAGLPSVSLTVDRLSESQKAYLEEALHLRQQLGGQIWSGWDTADIPLIVYNEAYAFLVGLPEPAAGWRSVPQGEQFGIPWEPVPEETFQSQAYYRQELDLTRDTTQNFAVQIGERYAASLTTGDFAPIVTKPERAVPEADDIGRVHIEFSAPKKASARAWVEKHLEYQPGFLEAGLARAQMYADEPDPLSKDYALRLVTRYVQQAESLIPRGFTGEIPWGGGGGNAAYLRMLWLQADLYQHLGDYPKAVATWRKMLRRDRRDGGMRTGWRVRGRAARSPSIARRCSSPHLAQLRAQRLQRTEIMRLHTAF